MGNAEFLIYNYIPELSLHGIVFARLCTKLLKNPSRWGVCRRFRAAKGRQESGNGRGAQELLRCHHADEGMPRTQSRRKRRGVAVPQWRAEVHRHPSSSRRTRVIMAGASGTAPGRWHDPIPRRSLDRVRGDLGWSSGLEGWSVIYRSGVWKPVAARRTPAGWLARKPGDPHIEAVYSEVNHLKHTPKGVSGRARRPISPYSSVRPGSLRQPPTALPPRLPGAVEVIWRRMTLALKARRFRGQDPRCRCSRDHHARLGCMGHARVRPIDYEEK